MNLRDLRVGESGRVVGFDDSRRGYRKKLLAMGLTPGTVFDVIRLAPMGDPVEIEVRSFKLSLRSDEAAAVRVEKT